MSRFPVVEICSVALGSPDLERSLAFYTSVWGLTEVARAEGIIYLRATGRDHHALSLQQHSAPEVLSITFRVEESSAINLLCASVQLAGGSIVALAHSNLAPDGGTIGTVCTPEGYVLNLIYGDAFHPDDKRSQGLPYRISHVNLNCKDIDGTRSFFERALGFCLTDRSKMMAFLRCNDDHHAVVLADSGVDGMNHIAFMMPDTESVMRGSGRMVDHGYPIGWGVGRHGPGDNVFAYFVDPTGFVIEYTAEVLQVDDTYRVKGPDEWVWPAGRTDHWGIAPPKPDSLVRAQLTIPFAAPTLKRVTMPYKDQSDTTSLQATYDFVIVGFGPVGAVAAGLLGQAGLRTLVVEKSSDIWQIPRAIAIDHEILRVLQNLGIADKVLPYTEPFPASEHFGAEGQLIRRIDAVAPPFPLGYTPTMVFTQPIVEAILRDHAASYPSVTVALRYELTELTQNEDSATLVIAGPGDSSHTVKTRYVIGCDGASSTVRRMTGIKLRDLIFDEPWLVVDVKVNPESLDKLPKTAAQYCNPERPTTFIIGPGNHRRWEIMLNPDEDPRTMEQPEQVWKLLAPWLQPTDGKLWRASSYRFHALLAEHWRAGCVFLAGDAAHQQPPFIGQGMCQGIRDVVNLCWKLAEVFAGRASDALLDTYELERSQHVHTLTSRIKAIGHHICERDPQAAAARDAALLAQGGQAPTVTRQEIVPPLEIGLLATDGKKANGTLFPQPWISTPTGPVRMDTITGMGWRLFVDGRYMTAGVASDIPAIPLGGSGLIEQDGVAAAWFDRFECQAALVRPDQYVFGTANDITHLSVLLQSFEAQLYRPD